MKEPDAPKRGADGWTRPLWAVEMWSKRDRPGAMLLGVAWHTGRALGARYEGEPARPLLFTCRRLARAWCKDERAWATRIGLPWYCTPVRVMHGLRPMAGYEREGRW